jgi:hypothetical protein
LIFTITIHTIAITLCPLRVGENTPWNDFIGSGPVQAFHGAEFAAQGNDGTLYDNLLGPFIVKPPGIVLTAEDKTCVDYGQESCSDDMDASFLSSGAPFSMPSSISSLVSTVPLTPSISRLHTDVFTVAPATSALVSTGGDDGYEELPGDEPTAERHTAFPVNRPTQVKDATAGQNATITIRRALIRMTVLLLSSVLLAFLSFPFLC